MSHIDILTSLWKEEIKNWISEAVREGIRNALQEMNEGIENPVWITRKAAAKHLEISLPTLDKLTKLKKIPVHKVGRGKRFDMRDIDNAIINHKTKSK